MKKSAKHETKDTSIKGKQYNIVFKYAKWCGDNKKFAVSRADFKDAGIKIPDVIKEFPGGLVELEAIAKERMPNSFKDIIDHRIWNAKRHSDLKKTIASSKKFIITTVVGGCEIHEQFLEAIQLYCKVNKATLLILVADNDIANLPEALINENIVFTDVPLNSNLYLSAIKILPKMIDPVTGLDRIGGKTGSFIFGSPKQRLKFVPVRSDSMIPHCIMTTGALTMPSYMGRKYYQKRTDYLAEQDHKLGAIVVEIEDNTYFHFRQVQLDKDGGFTDLGKRYSDKVEDNAAEALVMGDLHSGYTDPTVLKCWLDVAKETNCKRVVIHDGFDGTSINHHNKDRIIEQAILAKEDKLDLEDELLRYANTLDKLSLSFNAIDIVYSNHDKFLTKYLNTGMYVKDPHNHLISLMLGIQAVNKNNAIEWYVSQRLRHKDRFNWLKQDESMKICGVECGDHGDNGPNGSKGTIVSLEKCQEKAVYGHSHTPQILREAYQVGTSTYLRLSYNDGPSSWFNTSCLIYKGGYRQLINSVRGKYKQ
jgi:hypothetical protein